MACGYSQIVRRTQEQGLERMGASWAGSQGLHLWCLHLGRGRLRGSSGFHCAAAQCLSKQLCLCGSLVLRVCVERCAEEEGRQKSILCKSPE